MVEKIGKKSYNKTKFRAEFRLIEYEGGIPMGFYAYPFHFSLQQELPATFKDNGVQADNTSKWSAEIQYSVTAEVEMSGSGKVLQEVQPIIINKNLPLSDIQGDPVSDKKTVKICCCIPRGDVSLIARLDKKAYTSGEDAKLILETKNNSGVDIDAMNVKVMRVVTLSPRDKCDSSGSQEENTSTTLVKSPFIPNIMLTVTQEGCLSKANKNSEILLSLKKDSGEEFQPSTEGEFVKCIYHIDAGMEIKYAISVDVLLPLTIQAPKNKAWHRWEPPSWLYNCHVVNIRGPFAVPEQQLGSNIFANVPGFQTDPFS
ncbi:uncharacterized protein LOC116295057 isoform X2 [Actinia tenebrosa]|nr:uncharacterized protein LOC116295057 isoform X2 [Actinia tenebrosa]